MLIAPLDSYERMFVTDMARTLLCDFAAGDTARPLHNVDADWDEVFRGVCANGLLGLTHRYLTDQESQDWPPLSFRQSVHDAYRLQAIRLKLIYSHYNQVLRHLRDSGVDYMVLKGPALAHTVYPNPSLRSFNDLDLVVRERDWANVHRALERMGMTHDLKKPQPPPKLVPQAVIHQSTYVHRETKLRVEVHYDDLLNAGLASRDMEGFWERVVMADIEGVLVRVLSLEDQLIHLCAHVHYHGYTRLNWLSDIAFIVRDCGSQLNWQRMLKTVRVEEAQVGVYYSLYYLGRLLDVHAPDSVLAELRPDRFRRWWHENYLPEDEVLSLQPMRRPDFSFYHTPLRKRMLPDLLVMGRRREKLRYCLRLLLPPRDWLRDYYRLTNGQNLGVHYLLHPLKLTYGYLSEFVSAVF